MAGDWIKMRADLLAHPKVVRMSSMLKADRLRTIGALFAVWCLFDAHSEDGTLPGYSDGVLDELVGLKGCAAAMRAVNWLQSDDAGLTMPEFGEHNGKSAKVRAEDSKRKRIERTNVQEKPDKSPDKSRTDSGPEKRREEKREDIPPAVVARATRKCPQGFEVTPELRHWATENAPLVDVDAATDRLRDHTFKTAISDWPGAWRNWMRRDQEHAVQSRARGGGRQSAQAQTIDALTGGLATPKDSHALRLA